MLAPHRNALVRRHAWSQLHPVSLVVLGVVLCAVLGVAYTFIFLDEVRSGGLPSRLYLRSFG